jgi:Ferritin-like
MVLCTAKLITGRKCEGRVWRTDYIYKHKILDLMQIPRELHDIQWLKTSLQAALELELATLPPYLCALWSIKAQSGLAFDRIRQIIFQEMVHMALICNMTVSLGTAPRILEGNKEINYPGSLPGGVKPQLIVYLSGLTKTYVGEVCLQIEYPEHGPVELALKETFPTIGDFYDAILVSCHTKWLSKSLGYISL